MKKENYISHAFISYNIKRVICEIFLRRKYFAISVYFPKTLFPAVPGPLWRPRLLRYFASSERYKKIKSRFPALGAFSIFRPGAHFSDRYFWKYFFEKNLENSVLFAPVRLCADPFIYGIVYVRSVPVRSTPHFCRLRRALRGPCRTRPIQSEQEQKIKIRFPASRAFPDPDLPGPGRTRSRALIFKYFSAPIQSDPVPSYTRVFLHGLVR